MSSHQPYPQATHVAQALVQVLADTFTLYVKTLNFHWNVKGPHFVSLHALFESHYEALAGHNDTLAERIRQLGQAAPGSLQAFKDKTSLQECLGTLEAEAMVSQLAADHAQLVTQCQTIIQADDTDDVTQDLLIEQCAFHDKARWMLNSILGQ